MHGDDAPLDKFQAEVAADIAKLQAQVKQLQNELRTIREWIEDGKHH